MKTLTSDISLEVLGVVFLIKCKNDSCRNEIAHFFSGHEITPFYEETPDVVLFIDWEGFGRYLYRERPETEEGQPLEGVEYLLPGWNRRKPWTSVYPPLIPYHFYQNAGRFVALHAAAIAMPDGRCVLLPGEQGSGKTTSSLHLCTKRSGTLMSDEVAFIYVRSRVVVPMLLAMGVFRSDSGKKSPQPAALHCPRLAKHSCEIREVIFLEKGTESRIEDISFESAFRRIMKHVIDVGASPDETVTTLARMVRGLSIQEIVWNEYLALPQLLDKAFEKSSIVS